MIDAVVTLHRILARVARGASVLCLAISGGLFAASTALLTAEITLRYLFNHPLQNVSEMVTIAFVYVFLLGGAALYLRNEDVVLDYFFRRMPEPAQIWMLAIISLAIAATMVVVVDQTWFLMSVQGRVPTPSLRLPLAVQMAPLVIAAALIGFGAFVDALGCIVWRATGVRPAAAASPSFNPHG